MQNFAKSRSLGDLAMKSRVRPLAVVGIVGALAAVPAHAQSNAPAQVTQTVTVVAQREPVITVLAPRETSNAVPVTSPRQTPPGIGTAVDADGDGLADAPTPREGKSGRPTGKQTVPAAAPRPACADKARAEATSACATSNPQYKDKAVQGQNPLHEP
jgi:hypothetical protein